MRSKPLFGASVVPQASGLLDYGIDVASGYVSDIVKDVGDDSYVSNGISTWMAIEIPAGRWTKAKFIHNLTSAQTVYVGVPDIALPNLSAFALHSISSVHEGSNLHRVDFPYDFDASDGQFWLYYPPDAQSDTALGALLTQKTWDSPTLTWIAYTAGRVKVKFYGASPAAWGSYGSFTIGVVVNIDASPGDGMALAIADATETKAHIKVTSAKKIEGKFKNTAGTAYTLTSPDRLHIGHNLITLSYEQNVAVKLALNGKVVASTTPSNNPVFNTTLALGLGAQMLTGTGTSLQLTSAIIDDVFLAGGVLSDAELWDIYLAYITAAPLMEIEQEALIQAEV